MASRGVIAVYSENNTKHVPWIQGEDKSNIIRSSAHMKIRNFQTSFMNFSHAYFYQVCEKGYGISTIIHAYWP
jgi:hypothetical protein